MENKKMTSKVTPMMKQYLEIKKKHPEEILFFRLGDFYEMFFEDACKASKILDIALTSRQNGVPMCGIPYHATESYISRLIKAGLRVAICDQMESVPSSGTIVKREIVRIITPGTVVEANLIQSEDNNFLASVVFNEKKIGLAFIDISTGDFSISTIDKAMDIFRGEISKKNPSEIILRESNNHNDSSYTEYLKNSGIPIQTINDWHYDIDYLTAAIKDVYNLANIKGLGFESEIEIQTAGSILHYLSETQKKSIEHLKYPQKISTSNYMILDEATIINLELVQNQHDNSKNCTLFSVLDYTKTAMGRRNLEMNILHPLLQLNEIEKRLDVVQEFLEDHGLISTMQSTLKEIHDIERLLSRFAMGKSFPRDYLAMMISIKSALKIKHILEEASHDLFTGISNNIPDLLPLSERIENTIDANPAMSPEQGRIIKNGYNSKLDNLYELKTDAKTWILKYQEEEKRRLGITTLKIKYNRILGYYIEISKGQTSKVPDDYFRKQTLVGSERYTTESLQKYESDILTASDKITEIEKHEIERLLSDLLKCRNDLQIMASTIGTIDYYCSLAQAAIENRLTRPVLSDNGITKISEGRHPVVEKYFMESVFIPNDLDFDTSATILSIITGPNMSGKSTYIRMVALLQLMAQIGSFVPARKAELSIADRIFTRIGASDNISRGESTFLVEMNETAVILNNASDRSLIIMDEIGRGTSTYDGLSIAWAVVEYIVRYIKAKTLFATHYHELTKLGSKKGITNYTVMVKENINGVEFLHKVVPGTADKSYGIHVANLAGIPVEICNNATRILQRLEKSSQTQRNRSKERYDDESYEQLEIFNTSNHLVIRAIKNINLDNISPLEALNELSRLKKLIE